MVVLLLDFEVSLTALTSSAISSIVINTPIVASSPLTTTLFVFFVCLLDTFLTGGL